MENNKELTLKISPDDLKRIVGGIGVSDSAKRPSGMPCPQCHGFIPITMQQIVADGHITCPNCGLRLNINRPENINIIEMLKNHQEQNGK